ncbi:MAG: tyrosine-type recombinase/integrase [bacterium]|nr:tyrosine-type recombinase/integrase [bacterium]
MTNLAPHISTFFNDYLAKQRGASQHTADTYAYSFQLLFEFASDRLGTTPSGLLLEQLDALLVADFLEHLETSRGCTPSTRNVRLAAIKSFFRYLEYRTPPNLEQARRVLAIPFKKTDSRLVAYLIAEETRALLHSPDLTRRDGIRDYAMLHLAIGAGLRVSELTALRVEDLSLWPTPTIMVMGKGRRERALPLWKETASAIRRWLTVRGEVRAPELFVNSRGGHLSRWGFAHIVKKHALAASRRCPSLRAKSVSPHVLRHTCAIVALQATKDIRKVSLWLGHASPQSTEVYVRTDPSEKLEVIESIIPPAARRGGRFRPPDDLIARLRAPTYGEQKTTETQTSAGSSPDRST